MSSKWTIGVSQITIVSGVKSAKRSLMQNGGLGSVMTSHKDPRFSTQFHDEQLMMHGLGPPPPEGVDEEFEHLYEPDRTEPWIWCNKCRAASPPEKFYNLKSSKTGKTLYCKYHHNGGKLGPPSE